MRQPAAKKKRVESTSSNASRSIGDQQLNQIGIDRLDKAAVLPRSFYEKPTEEVSRQLLGKLLVTASPEDTSSMPSTAVALRITEVEAYLGPSDAACHTHDGTPEGKRTQRNASMWGDAGHAYVYLIYGMHHCLNLVSVGGKGEAVLVRAGTPVLGLDLVRRRRGAKVKDKALCDGPGKLCQALALTRKEDGEDLTNRNRRLWLCDDGVEVKDEQVRRLPRVGVDYAGAASKWPLRFLVS